MLAPAALSILMTTFREGRERNLALGVWGAVSGSGAAAGVLLGGVLVGSLGWSWIFFINVPVGALVLLATPWLLRESRGGLAHRHFDAAGAFSITSGLMLLVYALTYASQHGWSSTRTIVSLAASGVLLAGFIGIELRSPAPLLPLRIFRLRTLAGSNLASLLTSASLFSQFFLLTLYMQQVLHYSAMQTGAAYLAFALSVVVFSGFAQALVTRVGIRAVMPIGLAFSALSLVAYTRVPVHGFMRLSGICSRHCSSAASASRSCSCRCPSVRSRAWESDAGVASGLFNTGQQIGGAIGVAVATTVATTATSHYVSSHVGATAFGPECPDARLPGRVLRARGVRHRLRGRGLHAARTASARGARELDAVLRGGGMSRRLDGGSQERRWRLCRRRSDSWPTGDGDELLEQEDHRAASHARRSSASRELAASAGSR